MAVAPLHTLICCPPGPARTALEALLAESQLFEVMARIGRGDNLAERCRALAPDVLVLDEALEGVDVHRIARTLTLERPLPTLLLVDAEPELRPEEAELLRALRVHLLAKHRLASTGSVDRSNARTRLRLLATRSMEPKHTMPGDLSQIVDELLEEEELGSEMRASVHPLCRHPLDVVTLIVDLAHAREIAEVLPAIRASRVPVVMVVQDLGSGILLRRAASKSGLPTSDLEQSTLVRRMHGLLFAPTDRHMWLDGDVMRVEDSPCDRVEFLQSLQSAQGAALPILASESPRLRAMLEHLLGKGHPAAFFGRDEAQNVLGPQTLVWLLRNAWPRRV